MNGSIQLRPVVEAGELADVDALYRSVFGVRPDDNGLNVRLLVGITTNSGHVVGAFDGDRLIGFGLSFLGHDERTGRLYQYSQTVAVAADSQSTGVGRAIKYAQRDAALSDGIDLIRWVYDPMYARNAHFNLDVLGARVRHLHRHFYGVAAPGRDAGERTDRFVLDWDLNAPRHEFVAPADLGLTAGESTPVGEDLAVGIPADWRGYRRAHGDDAAAAMRERCIEIIAGALERGLVAVSCRRVDEANALYVFAPAEAAGDDA